MIPRGVRLRNLGNIRISSSNWVGKITPSSDPEFEEFDNVEHGLRALAIILVHDYTLRGLSTVAQIINRYAPPSDHNPTSAYAANVAKHLGVDPDDKIDVLEPRTLVGLIQAICLQEQGAIYASTDLITEVVGGVLAGMVAA